MPDAAKPTVSELVSQAVKDSRPSTTDGSQQAPGNQAGGDLKLPEYMKGQITEEAWAQLPQEARSNLAEYGKSLYGDYQRKTEGLAREREQLEDLKGRMETTLKEAVTNGATSQQTKSDVKAVFDELMDQAGDPQAREQLARLRRGILQETKADEVWKKLEQIEQVLGKFVQSTQLSRQDQLRQDLTKMSDAYHPLVEKYTKSVLELGVQYSNLSVKKLLQLVATEDEYDQAVQADGTKQAKKEHQRAKEASVTKSASATTGSFNATDKDRIPAKGGKGWYGQRWNWKTLVPQAVDDARANAPS